MSVHALIARDAPLLAAALGLDAAEARSEIRVLLGMALQVNRAWLIAHEHDPLPAEHIARYGQLLARRKDGEPMAYLQGEKEFFGRVFKVAPGVLVPRPETELLVELALEKAALFSLPQVLDLGTGSGCIAITLALECRACSVSATDRSEDALAVARVNAASLSAAVAFRQGDWFAALPERTGLFDLVVSNPPYVAEGDRHLDALRHEPLSALAAGVDGLDDIRRIVREAPAHLNPGGWLMLEHGWDQAQSVQDLMCEQAFLDVQTHMDLAGIGRVTVGRHT